MRNHGRIKKISLKQPIKKLLKLGWEIKWQDPPFTILVKKFLKTETKCESEDTIDYCNTHGSIIQQWRKRPGQEKRENLKNIEL